MDLVLDLKGPPQKGYVTSLPVERKDFYVLEVLSKNLFHHQRATTMKNLSLQVLSLKQISFDHIFDKMHSLRHFPLSLTS